MDLPAAVAEFVSAALDVGDLVQGPLAGASVVLYDLTGAYV
jgi:hypothetical protein